MCYYHSFPIFLKGKYLYKKLINPKLKGPSNSGLAIYKGINLSL